MSYFLLIFRKSKADIISQRIIACATSIDRSLVDTKGRDFVNRMKDSLPKLPPSGEDFGGSVVAESGATGEAIIKICESH